MRTFSVRDLREHTEDLIHGAESGKVSLVTKHGTPVFLAVPFDEVLIANGLNVAIAINVYRTGCVSLGKAARIAQLTIETFIEKLAAFDIDVVDYSAEELQQEIETLTKYQ